MISRKSLSETGPGGGGQGGHTRNRQKLTNRSYENKIKITCCFLDNFLIFLHKWKIMVKNYKSQILGNIDNQYLMIL